MVDKNIQKVIRQNIVFSVLCVILTLGIIAFYYLHVKPYTEHNEKHYEEAIIAINTTTNIGY